MGLNTLGIALAKLITVVNLSTSMTLETAEAVEDLTMSTDGTAYIVTTIALLGGVLAFYYFYIYNNPDEVCINILPHFPNLYKFKS